jgi:hypothetical protein
MRASTATALSMRASVWDEDTVRYSSATALQHDPIERGGKMKGMERIE